jgi:hypothetical protein
MGPATLAAVNATLGAMIPLLVDCTSSIAEPSGVPPIPTPCEKAVVAKAPPQMRVMKSLFIRFNCFLFKKKYNEVRSFAFLLYRIF